MLTLDDACAPRGEAGALTLDVPAGWRQGRGAYGGLVIAALVRAAEAAVPDPARRVRAVTAELPGAVEAGPAVLDVETLRAGASLTAVRVALRQGGEVRAHAVVTLAAARPGAPAWQALEAPASPPWREVAAVPEDAPMPEFARHFEFRVVEGVPFTGGPPRTLGWVRPRRPGAGRGAAFVAALADAWWPAALVALPGPRPIGTICYTLELLAGLDGLDPEAPLLHRAAAPVGGDGYFVEERALWAEDGRLVARNHQTFAIIK